MLQGATTQRTPPKGSLAYKIQTNTIEAEDLTNENACEVALRMLNRMREKQGLFQNKQVPFEEDRDRDEEFHAVPPKAQESSPDTTPASETMTEATGRKHKEGDMVELVVDKDTTKLYPHPGYNIKKKWVPSFVSSVRELLREGIPATSNNLIKIGFTKKGRRAHREKIFASFKELESTNQLNAQEKIWFDKYQGNF